MTDEQEIKPETKVDTRGTHPNSVANLRKFGSENANPQSQDTDIKPWSIRNSVRYLAKQKVNLSDKEGVKAILPKEPTVAQLIAANALAKATKGDMRAVEYATDQIDGKLAQVNLNADFADIQNMTDEEIQDELDRYYNQRTADGSPSSGSGESDSEEGISETPAG